jgi:hypothetical protein
MNPMAGKKSAEEANWPRAVRSILPLWGRLAFKRKLYTVKSTIATRKSPGVLSIFINSGRMKTVVRLGQSLCSNDRLRDLTIFLRRRH